MELTWFSHHLGLVLRSSPGHPGHRGGGVTGALYVRAVCTDRPSPRPYPSGLAGRSPRQGQSPWPFLNHPETRSVGPASPMDGLGVY